MKSCTLLTLILVCFLYLPAQNRSRDSVSLTIQLNNRANEKDQVDSVYLVFDRYDLNAAGIVKKVYHPAKNRIVMEKLPKGKYYIEVICLGKYTGHFNRLVMVHPRASAHLSFRLKKQDHYTVGMAYIPPQKIDFSQLSINRR